MPSRLSRLLSLERLRTYEDECRHQAAISTDLFSRADLTKLADTFRQAIEEIESTLEFSGLATTASRNVFGAESGREATT